MEMLNCRKKWCELIFMMTIILCAFNKNIYASQIVDATEQKSILVDGIEKEFKFVDSLYSDKPKGKSGVYAKRTRKLKLNSKKYLVSEDNVWQINSSKWYEEKRKGYQWEYVQTTGFSIDLPNRDYEVTVTFENPTGNMYSVEIWDERGKQTKALKINPGQSVVHTCKIAVINKNMKLFFVPSNMGKKVGEATTGIYIRNISLMTLSEREQSEEPSLHVMGDSICSTRSKSKYPYMGIGQVMYQCFGSGKLYGTSRFQGDNQLSNSYIFDGDGINIHNWAVSGQSTASFWNRGIFDNMLCTVCKGDYVIIQFGHNDINKNKPGIFCTTNEYRKNLELFIKGCKERGAICIVLTSIPRYIYQGNKIKSTAPDYKLASKKAVKKTKAVYIDTGKVVEDFMNLIGAKNAIKYYAILEAGQYTSFPNGVVDKTHLQEAGAIQVSKIIASKIKASKSVPAAFRQLITVSSDYYKNVEIDMNNVRVTKVKGKKNYTLSWKKQKNAKCYVVYRYDKNTNSYKKIARIKNTSYTLNKKYSKKQAKKMKVKAVLKAGN